MLEELIKFDEQTFLYLNGLGTPLWDRFWMYLSRTFSVITVPIYLLVLLFFYRFFGWKKTVVLILMLSLALSCTEQLSILFKNHVGRLRPCYDTDIKEMIRQVKTYCGGQYGYFSAHAANSFALAGFFAQLFKQRQLWFAVLLMLWSLLVSYSRIYIGVHYPLDVVTGMLVGLVFGTLFAWLASKFLLKF